MTRELTKEEAIKMLKSKMDGNTDTSYEWAETVRMAIKALDSYDKIIEQIKDEADYAYADFDRYKEDILYAEADELPDDDFRYGLRRAIEIMREVMQGCHIV